MTQKYIINRIVLHLDEQLLLVIKKFTNNYTFTTYYRSMNIKLHFYSQIFIAPVFSEDVKKLIKYIWSRSPLPPPPSHLVIRLISSCSLIILKFHNVSAIKAQNDYIIMMIFLLYSINIF